MRNFPKLLFSLNFLYIILIAAQVAAIIFLCIYIPVCLPVCLSYTAVLLITAITSTVLFGRKGASEVKCVWFVLIAVLPVAGALIYIIASVRKRPFGILNVRPNGCTGMSSAAQSLCGTTEVGYDKAVYFKSGGEFFRQMFEEISKAKERVYVEFYIMCRGYIWSGLLAALKSARDNGAEIKIILDGLGSAFKIGRRELKSLKNLGAEVKIFNRLVPLPKARLNMRDHRKIVAVDGKVAFTGGMNVSDEYANITRPYGFWKDSGLAVYGGAAKIFEGMFLSMWLKKYEMDAPQGGKYKCLPFYDSPPYRAFCEDAYICAISSATERVHIMTPYFCLSEKTASALDFAARRGVDVRIIIPHIPDKAYAFEITKAFARLAETGGVHFYEYTPGFLHAKCLICDDKVFLGSYNFDYRSAHYNYECGVMFEGNMTEEVEQDFNECIALSAPLSEGKLTKYKRFSRFVLRLFAPLI